MQSIPEIIRGIYPAAADADTLIRNYLNMDIIGLKKTISPYSDHIFIDFALRFKEVSAVSFSINSELFEKLKLIILSNDPMESLPQEERNENANTSLKRI